MTLVRRNLSALRACSSVVGAGGEVRNRLYGNVVGVGVDSGAAVGVGGKEEREALLTCSGGCSFSEPWAQSKSTPKPFSFPIPKPTPTPTPSLDSPALFWRCTGLSG